MQVRQLPDLHELGHWRFPISREVSKVCSGQASAVSPWGSTRTVKNEIEVLMGRSLLANVHFVGKRVRHTNWV
jgi:hypothetical protein